MLRRTLLFGSSFAGLSACAPVQPAPQIPPMPVERVPAPPRSSITLIFEPGHYEWDGADYRWIGGVWVPRGNRRLWVDGSWRRAPSGWVWEPAHWL